MSFLRFLTSYWVVAFRVAKLGAKPLSQMLPQRSVKTEFLKHPERTSSSCGLTYERYYLFIVGWPLNAAQCRHKPVCCDDRGDFTVKTDYRTFCPLRWVNFSYFSVCVYKLSQNVVAVKQTSSNFYVSESELTEFLQRSPNNSLRSFPAAACLPPVHLWAGGSPRDPLRRRPPWGRSGPAEAAALSLRPFPGARWATETRTTSLWTDSSGARTSPSSPTWSSPAETASRARPVRAPAGSPQVSGDAKCEDGALNAPQEKCLWLWTHHKLRNWGFERTTRPMFQALIAPKIESFNLLTESKINSWGFERINNREDESLNAPQKIRFRFGFGRITS